ncbi:hypothetical protein NE173_13525 [Clostridium botulinum]|nr:hypothetical protein RSJ10_398 [Clostridium botulinum]MCR1155800.1 hypothetical protein [Clostridium botulinum]
MFLNNVGTNIPKGMNNAKLPRTFFKTTSIASSEKKSVTKLNGLRFNDRNSVAKPYLNNIIFSSAKM